MKLSSSTAQLLSRSISVYAMSQRLSDYGDQNDYTRALAIIGDLESVFSLGESDNDQQSSKIEFLPFYPADYILILLTSIEVALLHGNATANEIVELNDLKHILYEFNDKNENELFYSVS